MVYLQSSLPCSFYCLGQFFLLDKVARLEQQILSKNLPKLCVFICFKDQLSLRLSVKLRFLRTVETSVAWWLNGADLDLIKQSGAGGFV